MSQIVISLTASVSQYCFSHLHCSFDTVVREHLDNAELNCYTRVHVYTFPIQCLGSNLFRYLPTCLASYVANIVVSAMMTKLARMDWLMVCYDSFVPFTIDYYASTHYYNLTAAGIKLFTHPSAEWPAQSTQPWLPPQWVDPHSEKKQSLPMEYWQS